MPDDVKREIVAEALHQCEVDFRRGLNSHGSPTFSVNQGIVDRLRRELKPSFEENLVDGGQQWHGPGGDGARVTRMAFYLGAIAACRAYAETMPGETHVPLEVAWPHVEAAFEYVADCCPEYIRGIYCARSSGEDSSA